MKRQGLLIFLILLAELRSLGADALDELMQKYSSTSAPSAQAVLSQKIKKNKKAHTAIPCDIQFASYGTEAEAIVQVEKLTQQGHRKAFYKVALVDGQKWYRVYLGTFQSHHSARAYLKKYVPDDLASHVVLVKADKIESRNSAEKKESAPEREPVGKPALTEETEVKKTEDEKSVNIQLKYTGDFVQNSFGGVKKKSTYLDSLSVGADFNLEKLLNLKGLSATISGLYIHGGHPSEFVGDNFGADNIEAAGTFRSYEAYFKQSIDDRLSILVGLRDLNADFDTIDSSSVLINGAFGLTPTLGKTGLNGPSTYPATALALTMKYVSPTSFYIQSGLFNATAGDPNNTSGAGITTNFDHGYLYIAEMGFASSSDDAHAKYGFGVWEYSQPVASLDTNQGDAINSGYYFLADQSLLKKISLFAKYSGTSSRINMFVNSLETGMTFQGLIPHRNEDQLTLGYAKAFVSEEYKSLNNSQNDESVVEIAYQIKATSWLSVTPDFQLIQHPGADKNLEDAQVEILRFQIQF